ncbi:alpha/beta fold hydrolase [Oceanibacterium hippocampi]|uniref:3-oxoadipate enol-lactonase 2 n=1 Tax=Oceanibacterium hippocampi TaxID=745714 RepID=A0A1Y5TJN3_9PROT|nr:alpha/beta hydrolase [Oceanibacterium hippocampi]SLN63505.1 3-oxoadipate enol-lactonase 2 [Oceanibacterium hippocampi]
MSEAHPRKTVAVGDLALSYREAGTGPALVLLHGIGSNSGSWIHQLAALGADHRVIAWDAPGYGRSDPLANARPAPADYADHLAAALDALGIATADVVGHSFGALVAAAFARRHPARIGRLVLSHPAVGFGAAADAPLPEGAAARVRDLETLGPKGLAEKRAARTCGPHAAPEVIDLTRRVMGEIRPEGYRAANHLLARGDLLADLAGLDLPIRVMAGTADPITPEARCRDVAARLPGADYVDLGEVGHPSYAEVPERYNEALRRFLRRNR